MVSWGIEKVTEMHNKLNERYNTNIKLEFINGFYAWGQFIPNENPWKIIIRKDNYMKGGTLMHEWSHAIEWMQSGHTNHEAMPFFKIQKKLMDEFHIKYNNEFWQNIPNE